MRAALATVLGACLIATSACGSGGGGEPEATTDGAGGMRLVEVGRFDQPVYVTAPPGDRRRLFVVEQPGIIRVMRDGRTLEQPFLDLRERVVAGGEQGLLGLAFPPDHAKSRRFYVYYTAAGDGANTLAEYRAQNDDVADPSTARILFAQPDAESNHNGGQLAFGPDGLLYAGLGDGGGGDDQHGDRGNAQSLDTLLGKILRIDPRPSGGRPYTIPAANPFARRAGARGEIYAYGLRNPWRFSFDRRTGALSIGDVGQDAVEEIDHVARGAGRGANFGWRPLEGTRRNFDEPAPGAIPPVLEFSHDDGWCSITGGYVVRDSRVPALRGRYVYGDFCRGELRSARLTPRRARDDRPIPGVPAVGRLPSFGEDARGRVYAVSLDGPVLRLAPAP